MPDPQPLSNRQRKIRERQAELNRELAAAKRSNSRTPFREAELQYLSRHPAPDYSEALDFRQPVETLLRDTKIKQVPLRRRMCEFSGLFGVKGDSRAQEQEQGQDHLTEYAYLHEDHPGLIYIPAAFTPSAQRTLIKACLKEYSRHPNKSNLDTHYIVPNSGIWDLHENVFTGKQPLDDPKVYVPRKATADQHAGGYGSDDDDDNDGNNDDTDHHSEHKTTHEQPNKKPKPSRPSVRSLVPITDETPTVPDNVPKVDPEPSAQVPILPPGQLLRKMRWITLGYQYHWPSKTYHFDQNAPFPQELSVLSKAVVDAVDGVGPYPYAADDFVAEAGVVNYYQLKDRLMGHVDRSELNKDAPLVSFSFGHSCIYLLGGPTRERSPTPILLQSGDILVMTGPCRSAFHGVPRIIEDTIPEYLRSRPEEPEWDIYADYLVEARINLNIRQVYPPNHLSSQPTPSSS
ncbi:hypothetical protein BC939DRAFT_499676 [Gamsiella multidivaricata]|uniref:uncharacterized protein n=1 Tax=Gamsiella multidivaricata TaxID=101098 RepID=UPI0022204A43|nr:uncharacterized protein BC939DRAFT_499676 [Gamsiella multidivaricata]KAG0366970.1 hypothetical protein BGZ54_004621 [Gamsiella multidivaricata]KAI7830183.1 hypothetical protein BC939DRAFT_499676 [Gamsiella multidivaricata]